MSAMIVGAPVSARWLWTRCTLPGIFFLFVMVEQPQSFFTIVVPVLVMTTVAALACNASWRLAILVAIGASIMISLAVLTHLPPFQKPVPGQPVTQHFASLQARYFGA